MVKAGLFTKVRIWSGFYGVVWKKVNFGPDLVWFSSNFGPDLQLWSPEYKVEALGRC